MNQKRVDDLSNLVIKYPEQPEITPSALDGVYELALGDLEYNYWFLIAARASTDEDCKTWATLRFIQHDDVYDTLADPFNKPYKYELLYNIGRSSDANGSSLYIYPGDQTVYKVRLDYIKQPTKMNFGGYTYIDGATYPATDCELSEHLHNELVDIAVQIASGIIEHPNYYQMKTQKVFSHE